MPTNGQRDVRPEATESWCITLLNVVLCPLLKQFELVGCIP